ncbi:DMT family transporter [Planktomarina sp.]|nr:DMT family transporter [Planktomarina sp.]MDB4841172.1 DMT family transporter [Planktomarina sp.]
MPKLTSKIRKFPQKNFVGILYFSGGMFLFAAVDTIAKVLTENFHPLQVAWSRQLGLFLGILILLTVKGVVILKTDHFYLQVFRGCLAAASALMFIFAISVVPIADAVAVSFVAPFFVTILGALVLRESVGVRRWTAIAIGFFACLIIIRPGFSSFQPAVLLVVMAALAYAFRQIISRILSSSDLTMTTVAYTGLTASFLLSTPLPLVWRTPVGNKEFLLIATLATLAALAEILVIKALELTQTVVLAPIHYTLLIWGTAYGWIIFDQFPDKWTWFGSAIIFATGIYVVVREWTRKSQL